MPYATQQNIIDRYSKDLLLLIADRDGDGIADSEVVDPAINDASAEIDTYVAKRYALPMATPLPEVLTRLCVDIVVYRLADGADVGTEEKRVRYDDARSLLRLIAKGEVTLGVAEATTTSSDVIESSSSNRRFNRDSMSGLL